jgi:hypothetical protein
MKIPLHLLTSFFSLFMVIASEARVLQNWMTSKGRESQLKHGRFYRYIERFYEFLVNYHPNVCTLEIIMTNSLRMVFHIPVKGEK